MYPQILTFSTKGVQKYKVWCFCLLLPHFLLSDLTIEHIIIADSHTSTKISSSLKRSGKAPVVIVSSAKQKVMQHVVIDKNSVNKQH